MLTKKWIWSIAYTAGGREGCDRGMTAAGSEWEELLGWCAGGGDTSDIIIMLLGSGVSVKPPRSV